MSNIIELLKEYYNCCDTRAIIIIQSNPINEIVKKMEVYENEKSANTTEKD